MQKSEYREFWINKRWFPMNKWVFSDKEVDGWNYYSNCKCRLVEYAAMEDLQAKLDLAVEALTKGRESPRELCALMAEGEGSDCSVYQKMANSAMEQIDEALAPFKVNNEG